MKNTAKKLALTAMIAAIYVVITQAFGFMAFREIQFRISEVMVLLVFIDPSYLPGLILGTFIANLIGPFGLPDAIIGSIHSFLGISMIILTRKVTKNRNVNLFLVTFWPAVFSFIIAGEIYYFSDVKEPIVFWLAYLTVAIGELVVITGLGYPLFRYILKKPQWVNILTIKEK